MDKANSATRTQRELPAIAHGHSSGIVILAISNIQHYSSLLLLIHVIKKFFQSP